MKADELWEKYGNEVLFGADMQVSEDAFFAALTEYGNFRAEQVRQQAVKVCRDKAEWNKGLGYHGHMERVATDCAAAIEKMPLP